MRREKAFELIGRIAVFRQDNVLCISQEKTIYNWQKGDECKVMGYMELEQNPVLVVAQGPDFFDIDDIPIMEISEELDFSRENICLAQ